MLTDAYIISGAGNTQYAIFASYVTVEISVEVEVEWHSIPFKKKTSQGNTFLFGNFCFMELYDEISEFCYAFCGVGRIEYRYL